VLADSQQQKVADLAGAQAEGPWQLLKPGEWHRKAAAQAGGMQQHPEYAGDGVSTDILQTSSAAVAVFSSLAQTSAKAVCQT
jgi:hypothetical protein